MAGTKTFPADFQWGTATASYQIEGAWNEGGRGWSIWDAFTHAQGGTANGDTGDVACDHYHRFKEDVALMKQMGLKNYRFSIAWPRIQPLGRGPPCPEGLAFYSDLIDCLIENGIEPLVTLYHWDMPLALQIESGGWLGAETPEAFEAYARICFTAFGDRVKTWLTFNEPWCVCLLGYGNGEHAPGLKSPDGSKVYRSGHTLLLSHARAVRLYREEFQPKQGGRIGITLNANWSYPKPTDDPDVARINETAAERAILFNLGWFADPIYKGDYPPEMRERAGSRLPTFTEEEKAMLLNSSDFFGLNHYSSDYVEECDPKELLAHWGSGAVCGFWLDMAAKSSADPSWVLTDMGWPVVPDGFKQLLLWIHRRYHPEGGVVVTENGTAVYEPTREAAENDEFRVAFLQAYVAAMHDAMEEGADVRGYFAWSFCDNFEWAFGYTKRFGLHFIDYETLERMPKQSAKWFGKLMATNKLELCGDHDASAGFLKAGASVVRAHSVDPLTGRPLDELYSLPPPPLAVAAAAVTAAV